MAEFATLVLGAVTDGLKKGVDQLGALGRKATEVEGVVHKSSNGMVAAMGRVAGAIAGAAAAALSVRAYFGLSDAWSDMQSKVGAAVKDMSAAPELMQRMVQIANASYSPLQQTVEVYSRNVVVLTQLGYTANEAANFTESLNHMLVITATKGEQAANVQQQLSRAMALGKLSGDGLETVLANGGRVAEALAKQLGTTTLNLRQFAAEGKITSKVISGSLLTDLEAVRKEAGEMPATVADGFQRISTGMQAIVGSFDQVTGVSGFLAQMLVNVGDRLADISVWIAANGPAIADFTSSAFGGMVLALKTVGIIIAAMVASQLPAFVIGLMQGGAAAIAAGISVDVMTIQFGLGAAAATAMTIAVDFLKVSLAILGGPVGIAIGLLTALAAVLYLNPPAATEAEIAFNKLAEAQKAVNETSDTFSKEKSVSNVAALKATTLEALNAAQALLSLTEAKLASVTAMGATSVGSAMAKGLMTEDAMTEIARLKEEIAIRQQMLTLANNLTVEVQETVAAEEALAFSAERTAEAKQLANEAFTSYLDKAIKAAEYGDQTLKTMQAQNVVAAMVLKYGQDSVEAVRAQNLLERDTLEAKLIAQGVGGELLLQILGQLSATQQMEAETRAVASAAENVRSSVAAATSVASGFVSELQRALGVASSIAATIGGLNFSNIGLAAKIAAMKAGMSPSRAGLAGDVAERRAQLAPLLNSPIGASDYAREQLDQYTRASETRLASEEEVAALTEAWTKANTAAAGGAGSGGPSGGGGAAPIEAITQAYDSLMASLDPLVAKQQKFIAAQKTIKNALEAEAISAEDAAKALALVEKQYGATAAASSDLAKAFDEGLNRSAETLAKSLGDWVVGGFKNIKNVFKSVADSFKSMVSNMISTAIMNPIKVMLGIQQGGVAGAAGAAGAVAPLGLFGGISAGFKSVISGFGSGGLAGAGSALSTAVGGATTSLASFGTAIGAIAAPLAAVGLLFAAFKKTTTVLATGLKVSIVDMATAVQKYENTKTTQFFGLSRSYSTKNVDTPAELSNPIGKAVFSIQQGIMNTAKALDVAAYAFEYFAYDINLNTTGMTQDAAMAELGKRLEEMGDAFAGLIPGLSALQKEGEGATATLIRLSNALSAVQSMSDTLGLSFDRTGLAGAAAASGLVDAFGTLEVMQSAVSTYYAGFYTEAERIATSTRQATLALSELGVAMPATRDQYRALVEAQDLTTASGQKVFAALVSMASVMDQVLPKIDGMTSAFFEMVVGIGNSLDSMINDTETAMQAARSAALTWYSAAKTLRDFVSNLKTVQSDAVTAESAKAAAETRYQVLLAQAMSGDRVAYGELTGAASTLLKASNDTANNSVQAAIEQARIAADLVKAANVADISGAQNDVIAGLLGQQKDVLISVRDYLASGGVLDPAHITSLNNQLGALQGAIEYARTIDYAQVVASLDVTATLISKVEDPALRALLENASHEIEGTVSFIANLTGMTPAEAYLALNAATNHLRTIDLLVNTTGLTMTDAQLALETGSAVEKTIKAILVSDMTAADRLLALAVSDTILRTVNVALGDTDPVARSLALATSGDIARVVSITIREADRDSLATRLALAASSSVTRTVIAALGETNPDAKMLALATSSKLIRYVRARVLEPKSDAVSLALAGASVLARRITATLETPGTDAAVMLALRADSKLLRTVSTLAGNISPDMLALALATDSALTKTVIGAVDLSGLSDDQLAFLNTLAGAGAGTINLGGTFEWNPSTGFQTWLETTTQGNIAGPLESLKAPMDALRAELTALTLEIKIQNATDDASRASAVQAAADAAKAEAARQKAITQAQGKLSKLADSKAKAQAGLSKAVAKTNAFDASTGGFIGKDGKQNSPSLNADGSLNYSADGIYGATADDMKKWRKQFWSENGLERQMFRANRANTNAESRLQAARQQIIDLGGVPAFAKGGAHSGGLRVVGEDGPELEVTGPSRIYSAKQTSQMIRPDTAELVEEVRKLRKELAEFKDQSRQLDTRNGTFERRTAQVLERTLERWENEGMPPERPVL